MIDEYLSSLNHSLDCEVSQGINLDLDFPSDIEKNLVFMLTFVFVPVLYF